MSLILVSNFAYINIIRSSSNPPKFPLFLDLILWCSQLWEFIYCLSISRISSLLPTDLTTYDTVKQAILRNTRLEDNALTHALSRCVIGYLHSYHIYCISTYSLSLIVLLIHNIVRVLDWCPPLLAPQQMWWRQEWWIRNMLMEGVLISRLYTNSFTCLQ